MRILLTAIVLISTISLFSFKSFDYSEYIPEDYAEVIEADYLFTTNSEELKSVFSEQLRFDKIDRIDASYSKKQDVYFYTIFGKEGLDNKFELVEIDKENQKAEKFPHKIEAFGAFRKSYSSHPRACDPICQYRTTNCIGFSCWD